MGTREPLRKHVRHDPDGRVRPSSSPGSSTGSGGSSSSTRWEVVERNITNLMVGVTRATRSGACGRRSSSWPPRSVSAPVPSARSGAADRGGARKSAAAGRPAAARAGHPPRRRPPLAWAVARSRRARRRHLRSRRSLQRGRRTHAAAAVALRPLVVLAGVFVAFIVVTAFGGVGWRPVGRVSP